MVGRIGQLAEVALDDLAGFERVRVNDRLSVLDRRFVGEVFGGAGFGGERDVRIVPQVLHPLGFTAGGHQIFHAVDVDRGDGDFLRLLACALDDGQCSLWTAPVAIAIVLMILRLNHG